MLFWLIPLILIAASLVVTVVILLRKMSALSVIDVESIPGERERKVKERIILERFDRLQKEKLGRVGKGLLAFGKTVAQVGRRVVQRLYRLEQYYEKLKHGSVSQGHAVDPETIKRLLDAAENFVRQEEYIQAEKRYIEIISHNPKHVGAYEGLGNLYLTTRQYAQARETLTFALRLDPENASIRMSMADLETAEGHGVAALEHLRKAVNVRQKNPRYLDAYIEAALSVKEVKDAKEGIKLLKEVNSDNQKLEDFEERLKKIE